MCLQEDLGFDGAGALSLAQARGGVYRSDREGGDWKEGLSDIEGALAFTVASSFSRDRNLDEVLRMIHSEIRGAQFRVFVPGLGALPGA